MRSFETFEEAMLELQRDVYKGSKTTSTRVQSRIDQELPGRERLGYDYAILGGFPETPEEIVKFGAKVLDLKMYQEQGKEIISWLHQEVAHRIHPELGLRTDPSDNLHPAISKVKEGNHYGYTYPERLLGASVALYNAVKRSPDSRRAFWPIFRTEDAIRAAAPTRIPCSLGYEIMVRQNNGNPELILFYLQRSADFDTFLITDVWLARQFQIYMAKQLEYDPGFFSHYIISLHSFSVEQTEVY